MKSISCFMVTLSFSYVIFIFVSFADNLYVNSSEISTEADINLRQHKDKQVTNESPDYSVVEPIVYYEREKRAIYQKNSSSHITIQLPINNKEMLLDLILNKQLISKDYFRRIQENGTCKVQKFDTKDIHLCHYTGKVRNKPDSWVALSTCDGLSGVIYDGDQTHYIEKNKKTKNEHFLYSGKNLVNYEEEANKISGASSNRHRRSVKAPWNSNNDSRYVELVLVVDHAKYEEMNKNLKDVEDYCMNIANIMNGLYAPLNIFIALVGVVVWTERDEIEFLPEARKALGNFLRYRRDKLLLEHPNDYAQLITTGKATSVFKTATHRTKAPPGAGLHETHWLRHRRATCMLRLKAVERLWPKFDHPRETIFLGYTMLNPNKEGTGLWFLEDDQTFATLFRQHIETIKATFEEVNVGWSFRFSLCEVENSGGVASGNTNVTAVTASLIANMLGYSFGMDFDSKSCKCPEKKCIMNSLFSWEPATHWSLCSHSAVTYTYKYRGARCLRNKPKTLFHSPVCGNGFVEDGEECDCGLPEHCGSKCCNATTCKLHRNATCATGECCNFETCRFTKPGKLCRQAVGECDLPEFCLGDSEFCPPNAYKMDTTICGTGSSHCHLGHCPSLLDQCQFIWGKSGRNAGEECYKKNIQGNVDGNCGYHRIDKSYDKCNEEDVLCGMLQCHRNKTVISKYDPPGEETPLTCKTAIIDSGEGDSNPGMVPNGAKCGEGKMCLRRKCVSISTLQKDRTCPHNCYNNGWCNNFRHCHCKPGYTLPYCRSLYFGGSVDSGLPETELSSVHDPLLL